MVNGNGRPEAEILFEVSWEICNKVGGINTVVKSKVNEMSAAYGKGYYVVGPYFPDKIKGVFVEMAHPEFCGRACDELKEWGIIVHYGRWLTGDKPAALLLDFNPLFSKVNDIKRELWDKFGIDSLNSPYEFDEPVIFGWAAGMVIEKFKAVFPEKKIIAHVHEWIAGAALLYLKARSIKVPTIFTTHATVLGRSMANSGVDIYAKDRDGRSILESIDMDKEAYNRQVQAKHLLEKACAHNADVFTAVSDMTATKSLHILGKRPDLVLPNGIDIDKFPSREDCSVQHRSFRDRILMFLTYYFYPYYPIDFDETRIIFTAARYEFHDKGIDVLIKALGRLNSVMKKEKCSENVVAFFYVPTGIRGVKRELVENNAFFNDIVESMDARTTYLRHKVISTVVGEKDAPVSDLLPKDLKDEIYPKLLRFKREEKKAPVCTHDLMDPHDQILRAFAEAGLQNSKEDCVKVIFYPIYLTGADNLLNLNYYEAMQGSHFGIFPSFYEPYGYTPLECAALAVSSLTTDTSGFGQFIMKQPRHSTTKGIYVLRRMDKSEDEIVADLLEKLHRFLKMPKKLRVEDKFEARRLAELSDWKILAKNYIRAHNLALSRMKR
ncbi:TPA: glycosyltransferase [Candidatus Woesearchaeota archaeon]|nr:glycosyltransferase [Candidatus Woesearchaeota archaeon]